MDLEEEQISLDILENSSNESDKQEESSASTVSPPHITNPVNSSTIPEDFDSYIDYFKKELEYVEDSTFSWNKVFSLLVINLSNADLINANKTNKSNNSSQIAITGESSEGPKLIDFFPIFRFSQNFKGRIIHKARINLDNISKLSPSSTVSTHGWLNSQIRIKTRQLNKKNPTIHICYGDDLAALRKALYEKDFMIFTRQMGSSTFEAFGLKTNSSMKKDKFLLISPRLTDKNDIPEFAFDDLIDLSSNEENEQEIQEEENQGFTNDNKKYVRYLDIEQGSRPIIFFEKEDDNEQYLIGDYIWAVNKKGEGITHRLEVFDLIENSVYARIKHTFIEPIRVDQLKKMSDNDTQVIEYISNLLEGNEE